MDGHQIDQMFKAVMDHVRTLGTQVDALRLEAQSALTDPQQPVTGASEDVKSSLRLIEDQITMVQRALGRGEMDVSNLQAVCMTVQHVIGFLRKEAGDPRPFDRLAAVPMPSPGSYVPSIESLPEHMPDPAQMELPPIAPPVAGAPQLPPELHDAPRNVGALVGAYFAGNDADKANILNTPVADGGPYNSEQFNRWRKALQMPSETPARGPWKDLSGDKPEQLGPNE